MESSTTTTTTAPSTEKPTYEQGTTVFVGNMPFSSSWQDLKDLFSKAGTVAFVDIPRDSRTNRPRGYGLVRFASLEEAQKAVEMFNGYDFNGRELQVREDQKKEDRPARAPREPRSDDRPARSPQRSSNNNQQQSRSGVSIFVGNLSWGVSWQDLKDEAKEKGLNPTRAHVATGEDGRSRGWGTLTFETDEEADTAIRMLNGLDIKGREIEARHDRRRNQ